MPRNHNLGTSALRNRNRVTNKTRLKVVHGNIDADALSFDEDEEKARIVSTAGVDAEDANVSPLCARRASPVVLVEHADVSLPDWLVPWEIDYRWLTNSAGAPPPGGSFRGIAAPSVRGTHHPRSIRQGCTGSCCVYSYTRLDGSGRQLS